MSSDDKTNNCKPILTVWFFTLAAIWVVGVSLVWIFTRSTPDTDKFETYKVTKFGTLVRHHDNMFTYLDVTMSDGETTTVYCNNLRTLYDDEVIMLNPADTLYVSKSTLTGQPFDHTTRFASTCFITKRHETKKDDVETHKSVDDVEPVSRAWIEKVN